MSDKEYMRRWRGIRAVSWIGFHLCWLGVWAETGSFRWAAIVAVGLLALRTFPTCSELDGIEARLEHEEKKAKERKTAATQ